MGVGFSYKSHYIAFDRDWMNLINFKHCKNMEGGKSSARPDFFLPSFSAKLKSIVILGNDEFAHRQYPCEFQRIFNIATALEQNVDFTGLPIFYIRFNPHYFQKDGIFHNLKLNLAHEVILSTLHC